MKRTYAIWYALFTLLALTPVGIRVLTWASAKPQPIDATMAEAGQTLFHHQWKPNDSLSKVGDGLGPVFNADSCVACHHDGGPGGAGGLKHNVTTFTVRSEQGNARAREGVVHARARATRFQETLAMVSPRLPALSMPTLDQIVRIAGQANNHCLPFPQGVHISQRNTPALFGAKLIDDLPDRDIIAMERSQRLQWGMASSDSEDKPVGRALRLANGRVGKFGWKGQTASLAGFVQAACANELGLGNPGQAQPRPLGNPEYAAPGLDLTQAQCDQLTSFVASLRRPVERLPEKAADQAKALAGRQVFSTIGCADCHAPQIGSVDGLYSDLLLHRMGQELQGGGSYNEPPLPLPDFKPGEGPQPGEWRTPPLWGVADSAPYLHDGRAPTLEVAIRFHGGQASRAAQRFSKLNAAEQGQLLAFLSTLRAP